MKVSVVIPVFNNEKSVAETMQQVSDLFSKKLQTYELEVIFVNDGSTDKSWENLQALEHKYPTKIRIARLSRNFGQISAIFAGYSICTGDVIITISADLQDPISLMEDMIHQWENGHDVVIAHRSSREDDSVSNISSRLAYGIARKSNPKIPVGGFDYILLSKTAIEILNKFEGRHRFFQGDILWIGFSTCFLPYSRLRRDHGKSGWSFSKKFKYFIDLLIDSSYFPIRLMSILGLMLSGIGLIYSLVIFYYWIINKTPFDGWTPIMLLLLLIGGGIMTMLGVIGEYIWRIHDDIKGRPLFIIEKFTPPLQDDKVK